MMLSFLLLFSLLPGLAAEPCPGPVGLVMGGRPFRGRVALTWAGQAIEEEAVLLPEGGWLAAPDRPCGPVTVIAWDEVDTYAVEVQVEAPGPLVVDLAQGGRLARREARHAGPATRPVTVTLPCEADCPERLLCRRPALLWGPACEGGGDTWSCACPEGEAELVGRWSRGFPAWGERWQVLGRVPAAQVQR